ncbi:MAG TPA: hypothetical protein VGT02_09510 [Methylomirabilota bacterium]|jgi:hypothetical protein|nr:hypothetical protein [Methylomirabilota bacterium]
MPWALELALDDDAAATVRGLWRELAAALLEAQADCHRRLAAFGRGPWAYYAPGAWVPHCTLVQEAGAGLDRALAVARRAALPRRGRLERAELVEFRPVRCHVAVPLARRAR